MWLIIAVVLLLIFAGMKVSYGVNEAAYNTQKRNRESEHEAFVAKYVSESLEDALRDYINNEDNFESVKKEVDLALSQMPHWSDSQIRSYSVGYNHELAMHIMLANRGKVSSESTKWGIMTPWRGSGYEIDRYKSYELVDWIKNTLAKQNVYVTPVFVGYLRGHSKYYWKGTFSEISNRYLKDKNTPAQSNILREDYLEFGPHLLPNNFRAKEIPAPYYDKSSQQK